MICKIISGQIVLKLRKVSKGSETGILFSNDGQNSTVKNNFYLDTKIFLEVQRC